MGFMPEDAKWYLADIVEEITIEGEARKVVQVNTFLIRANSPDEAFDKSLALGKEGETSFENSAGQQVTYKFRGLQNLTEVYDELEDGAEITFKRHIGMTDEEIDHLIRVKADLSVFAPNRPFEGPDCGSREIREMVYDQLPHLKPIDTKGSKGAK